MYDLTITAHGVQISQCGTPTARLPLDHGLTIGVTYRQMQATSPGQAQAFLHGVVLGLTCACLTGAVAGLLQPEQEDL